MGNAAIAHKFKTESNMASILTSKSILLRAPLVEGLPGPEHFEFKKSEVKESDLQVNGIIVYALVFTRIVLIFICVNFICCVDDK
jgi:hypothetical protein